MNSSLNKKIILFIILLSYVMIILDVSIVITALPKIKESLNFSDTGLSWIQNTYMLAIGGFLLLSARLGDIYGRKKMYLIGLSIFSVSSLFIGLSNGATTFLIARTIQGIGASILAPSTLALLSSNFAEGPERNKAVGYYGAMGGIGSSIGLVLGGLVAGFLSWRIGFLINFPIGILLFILAYTYIHETQKHTGEFDIFGAITSILGMSGFVYGIISSETYGWQSGVTWGILCISILALTGFVINEKRVSQAILPLSLFASRERVGAYIGRFFFIGSIGSFYYFSTQYLQNVLGFSPIQAGFIFLINSIPNFIAAMQVAKFSKKYGNKNTILLGLCLSFIGLLSFSFIDPIYGFWGVIIPFFITGVGQGLSLSPLTVEGIAGVEAKNNSAASGLVNVAHQIGGSIVLSILVVVFTSLHSNISNPIDLLAHKITSTMFIGSMMILLGIVIVYLMIPKRNA